MQPKVSVIVPVYNVESYLEKCLDSLVNQMLFDLEIIIVNDGSKDNSQQIINDFAARFPNKIKALGYTEISKEPIKNPLIDINRQFENDNYLVIFKKEYVSGNHLVNMTIIKK